MGNFVLEGVYHVRLGLLDRVSGDLFQHFELAFLDQCDLGLLSLGGSNLLRQALVLAFQRIGLSVKIFFLLL